MIKFFEKIIVKKAETEIKYKKIFAWMLFIEIIYTIIKIAVKVHKAFKKYSKNKIEKSTI